MKGATAMLTPSKIAVKLAPNMAKNMPQKLAAKERGCLRAHATRSRARALSSHALFVSSLPPFARSLPRSNARSLPTQGITATAEVKLVHGPLIVILVTVKEVDANVILEKLGEKNETAFVVGSCVLQCLPKEVRVPRGSKPCP
eukprot:3968798-Prymnesium_polylepis.1